MNKRNCLHLFPHSFLCLNYISDLLLARVTLPLSYNPSFPFHEYRTRAFERINSPFFHTPRPYTMVNASAPRAIPGILAAGVHAGWVQHTVSTAKCDCCPGRGDSIVQRCVSCRLQICRDCVVSGRLDTDARHVLDVDDVSWVAPKSKRAKKKQPIVRRKLTASVRGRGSNRGRGRGRQVSARVVKDETPSPMLAMSPLTEADSSQDGHSTRQVQSPDGSVQTPDVPLTGLTSPQLSSIQVYLILLHSRYSLD